MSVRTKRGEGELGIDDSKFSIFHTNGEDLEGQPIYNRFALVDHMKAVPPPLTGNYMPPSNIPDIDASQMVYGKKATGLSEIKTNDDSISHSNDSVLFYFSDRSSEPSTNDLQTCDSSVGCSRPNLNDHDSTYSISSVSAPANESRDTIVIDCDRQEDFPSVCSIETDVKSSKTLKGYIGNKTNRKPVNPNRPKPVSAGQPNPVFAGQPNPVFAGHPNPVFAGEATLACNSIPLFVSAGDGILGPRPLNIQPKSTYFHSFTHNNQPIIFLITHNLLYSLYMTGGLNRKTAVKPSAGWPWTKYGMMEKAKDRGIVDSGCSRSMSGNKDKLEDFEDFDGGEVTFGGSTGKISGKGTIKTKKLNFENVLYVEELQHFNLMSVSQMIRLIGSYSLKMNVWFSPKIFLFLVLAW
nr:ribonuclease H-like domain-containing protein [Tanacetum cinerariifolium]